MPLLMRREFSLRTPRGSAVTDYSANKISQRSESAFPRSLYGMGRFYRKQRRQGSKPSVVCVSTRNATLMRLALMHVA